MTKLIKEKQGDWERRERVRFQKKKKKKTKSKRERERETGRDRQRERESCVGGEYRQRWCSPPLLWEQLRHCRYHGRNSRREERKRRGGEEQKGEKWGGKWYPRTNFKQTLGTRYKYAVCIWIAFSLKSKSVQSFKTDKNLPGTLRSCWRWSYLWWTETQKAPVS